MLPKKQRRELQRSYFASAQRPAPAHERVINLNRLRKGRLLVTHGSHCAYCGRNLTPKTVTRDHVVARAQGGADCGNILPACLICNRLKGPLTLEQFREVARTAWEYRRTADPGAAWRHLFSRFGKVGVSFYCDRNTLLQGQG
jgi:5-methylcytosine-specific restriction endonuclease McrA